MDETILIAPYCSLDCCDREPDTRMVETSAVDARAEDARAEDARVVDTMAAISQKVDTRAACK